MPLWRILLRQSLLIAYKKACMPNIQSFTSPTLFHTLGLLQDSVHNALYVVLLLPLTPLPPPQECEPGSSFLIVYCKNKTPCLAWLPSCLEAHSKYFHMVCPLHSLYVCARVCRRTHRHMCKSTTTTLGCWQWPNLVTVCVSFVPFCDWNLCGPLNLSAAATKLSMQFLFTVFTSFSTQKVFQMSHCGAVLKRYCPCFVVGLYLTVLYTSQCHFNIASPCCTTLLQNGFLENEITGIPETANFWNKTAICSMAVNMH